MSAVTSRRRVRDSPTCKLPRLTIGTDPVRDAFGASYDAEIPRTPGADYDCALMIAQRSLSHPDLSRSSPHPHVSEARIGWHAFQSDRTAPYLILEQVGS
jgi:hypothetical protein